jgi:hypothetical protein
MNNVLSAKMNSPVSMTIGSDGTLVVTNAGGVDVALSRLWIISSSEHLYADLENITNHQPWVDAGFSTQINLNNTAPQTDKSPLSVTWDNTTQSATVQYAPTGNVTFRIVTTNGNTAACSWRPSGTEEIGGSSPIGSIVIADFQNFDYYNLTGNTFDSTKGASGYSLSSKVPLVFNVTLTNLDPQHRAITLNAQSQLFFIYHSDLNYTGYTVFYIVDVGQSANIATVSSYSVSTELDYNVPASIYFASNSSSQFNPQKIDASGVLSLNLALLGTIGGNPFGQNIPFISVYVNT